MSSACFLLSFAPSLPSRVRNCVSDKELNKKKRMIKTFSCIWHSKMRYYKWLSGALSLASWWRGRLFTGLLLCIGLVLFFGSWDLNTDRFRKFIFYYILWKRFLASAFAMLPLEADNDKPISSSSLYPPQVLSPYHHLLWFFHYEVVP